MTTISTLKETGPQENQSSAAPARIFAWIFGLNAATAALSLLGTGIAGMLWWSGRRDVELPCTGDGLGCGLVEASRWSHVNLGGGHPVPVALLGLLGYVALLTLAFGKFAVSQPRTQAALHRVVLVISGLGAVYSLYLQYVAHFKINAFCVWCFSSACVLLLIFALAVWEARLRARVTAAPAETSAPRNRQARLLLPAALWAASLGGSAAFVHGFVAARDWSDIDTARLAVNWPAVMAHAAAAPRGDAGAPYTLVEFGDFQCPPCGSARPVLEQMLRQSPHQVNLVFVHRPLPRVHPWALSAGEAGQAAAVQGRFWPMYDILYSHQAHLEPSFYGQYAASIGLSQKQFQAAVQSHQYQKRVEADAGFADSFHIFATPTLLVRDNRSGAVSDYIGPQSIKKLALNPPWASLR